MNITYSDQEIEALIQERKVLPDNWHNILLGANSTKGYLVVTGDNGNNFRIIARHNDTHPLDFSVILTVTVPLSNRQFRLRRYNGWTNPHYNSIEKEEVHGFHTMRRSAISSAGSMQMPMHVQRTGTAILTVPCSA